MILSEKDLQERLEWIRNYFDTYKTVDSDILRELDYIETIANLRLTLAKTQASIGQLLDKVGSV